MRALKKFFSSPHFITLAVFFFALAIFLMGGIIDLPSGKTLRDAKASIPDTGLSTASTQAEVSGINNETFDIEGELHQGDTLSKSFQRYGVPSQAKAMIIENLRQMVDFKKLRPGNRYSIKVDDKEELLKCVFEVSPLESYTLVHTNDGYRIARDKKFLESKKLKISGSVNSTLFEGFPADIKTPKLVYAFADIFSSRIDFNTETRVGDRFSLIVEEYYLFGKFIGYGPILAGKYERSNGELFEAFRYNSDGKSDSYFDRDGRELGSSFLRSPVTIGRVSSRFSWRRKHPILGVIRQHLGVDLAAPIGTPVMAAADGRVTFVGTKGGFGKQIILAHGNEYRTHYGHLSRFKKGLKVGQRVKQKEIIGYVGSTGLSTGPHLDYRVQQNGTFKNPFSLKFRPKSVLQDEKLAKLRENISPLVAELYAESPNSILETVKLVVEKDQHIAFL